MSIKRIPLVPLQKAIYADLLQYQTTPVYDDVPHNAKLPYITLGSFTCKNNGAKNTEISDVTLQIHIWSEYSGKAEVNEIANDVIAVLSAVPMDLSADNFKTMIQEIDFFEAFPEESAGYHGVITFVAKIQNLGG